MEHINQRGYEGSDSVWESTLAFLSSLVPTNIERILWTVGGVVGGFVSVGVGGFDDPFKVLCGFVIVDYVTGTASALKNGQWSSRRGFKGLAKKVFLFLMVGIAHGLDVGLKVDFLRDAVIMGYILNEAGSTLENLERLGYGNLIPSILRKGLEQIKEQKKDTLMEGKNKKDDNSGN